MNKTEKNLKNYDIKTLTSNSFFYNLFFLRIYSAHTPIDHYTDTHSNFCYQETKSRVVLS